MRRLEGLCSEEQCQDRDPPSRSHERELSAQRAAPVKSRVYRIEAVLKVSRQVCEGLARRSTATQKLGTSGGVARFQYANQDARFTGAEGSLAVQLAERWVAEASVSVVLARFTSARDSSPVFTGGDTTLVAASEYPPLIPPAHGSVGVRYETPGFQAGVAGRWAGRQSRTGDFESETAGYGLLDAFASVRWTLGGRLHSVTLRGDNLLDKAYRDHLSRLKDVLIMPGRGFTLNYRVAL